MAILGLTIEGWFLFLIAGAAGGAFGAAIGALPALSITGLVTIVYARVPFRGQETARVFGLGPVFGPHVAFAGGFAAAAYAARKGYLDTDFEYYEAKNIARPLGPKPDVMAVGAAFGAFGIVVWQVSIGLGLPVEPAFLSVLVSAFVHRLVLGFPLVGSPEGGWLDMSAFDPRSVKTAAMGGEILSGGGDRADHGDRLAVEPWLPNQYEWANVVAIGLVAGVIGSYVTISTGNQFLAFGLSAVSLLFLAMGVLDVPVTHHVTLPASFATMAFLTGASRNPLLALVVGAAFGLVSALVAEVSQRVFYAHADTHFDAAAAGIVVSTLLLGILIEVGLLGDVFWF